MTLFLFLQKRKPVLKEKKENEMNRKAYIVGRRNILHSSIVSTIGWERGKGKGDALDKYPLRKRVAGEKMLCSAFRIPQRNI